MSELKFKFFSDATTCSQADPDAWFPEAGISTRELKMAKTICVGCPSRVECFFYAFDNEEQYGIWGGVSARLMAPMRTGNEPLPEWAVRKAAK